MKFELQYQPAHTLATAHLRRQEAVRAEASAMVSMTSTIRVETTGPLSRKGGLFKNLKRAMLGGETFFTNVYTAVWGPGHVTFAPALSGDMIVHELANDDLFIQGSSYVAAPDSVSIDTRWQGFRGFFSGETLFFLHARGRGPVLLNAFGAIASIDLDGELIVDTGHLVAFTNGIDYQVGTASRGLVASYLSGEGFVLKMSGRGRLYVQTRNPHEYGTRVGSMLPPREG